MSCIRSRESTSTFKFKISPNIPEIIELINSNPVCAISAQTGSGKTLCIPHALAESGLKVRCALPFVVATRAASDFQRKHTSMKIGFAAAREIKYDDSTQIVYGTTGHFTNKIRGIIKKHGLPLNSKNFTFLGDVFIVDEVHTGTTQISELVGLLKYVKTHMDSFDTRIVFTSATMNCTDVSRCFTDFPVHEVVLDRLPITHIYLAKEHNPRTDDPTQEILSIIRKELDNMAATGDMYHLIIFRPGIQEVEKLVQLLEKKIDANDAYVIQAYSDLAPEELHMIFEDYGVPKIVVGTNIIESSVTIDNAGVVIDDGLVKRVYTNDTGGQKLVTSLISQAEGIQRAGRTARTRPGRAYHIYTEDFRNTEMDAHHPLEIDRVPIHTSTLGIIDACLVPTEILGVSKHRQDQAIDTLISMEMIKSDPTGKTLGIVTDAGNFVSHVNLGIYNSYMIYLATQEFLKTNDEYLMISTVALAVFLEIYGPPPFYVPRRRRGQIQIDYQSERSAHIEKYFSRFMGKTEIHTLINLYWTMSDEIFLLKSVARDFQAAKTWAIENSMNNKKIKEFHNIMKPIMISVSKYVRDRDLLDSLEPPENMEEISQKVISLFTKAYHTNTFTLEHGNVYIDKKHQRYRHATRTYCSGNSVPTQIIAAQVMEIQDDISGSIRRVVGLSVPIESQ